MFNPLPYSTAPRWCPPPPPILGICWQRKKSYFHTHKQHAALPVPLTALSFCHLCAPATFFLAAIPLHALLTSAAFVALGCPLALYATFGLHYTFAPKRTSLCAHCVCCLLSHTTAPRGCARTCVCAPFCLYARFAHYAAVALTAIRIARHHCLHCPSCAYTHHYLPAHLRRVVPHCLRDSPLHAPLTLGGRSPCRYPQAPAICMRQHALPGSYHSPPIHHFIWTVWLHLWYGQLVEHHDVIEHFITCTV